MPLPAQIDYKKISKFISPDKDIEGMHPQNIGKILFGTSNSLSTDGERSRIIGKAQLIPCTAAAVILSPAAGVPIPLAVNTVVTV